MLASLAFVPVPYVITAFESLSENFPLDAPALALIDYFEDTYIGRLCPGGQRRNPLFAITVWNMHDQTAQGWHRSFQANVGGFHLNSGDLLKSSKESKTWPKCILPKLVQVTSQNLSDVHVRTPA